MAVLCDAHCVLAEQRVGDGRGRAPFEASGGIRAPVEPGIALPRNTDTDTDTDTNNGMRTAVAVAVVSAALVVLTAGDEGKAKAR